MGLFGSITNVYHTVMVSKYAVKGLEWVKEKIGDCIADYANTLSADDINRSFTKMSETVDYDVEGNREQVDNMATQLSTFTSNLSAYYEQNPDAKPNLAKFMGTCSEAITENPDMYASYFLSKGVDPEKIQAFNEKCAEGTVDFSDAKSIAMATFGSYATVSGISKETQGGEQQTEIAEEQLADETQTDNAATVDTSVEVSTEDHTPRNETDKSDTSDYVYDSTGNKLDYVQEGEISDEAKKFNENLESSGTKATTYAQASRMVEGNTDFKARLEHDNAETEAPKSTETSKVDDAGVTAKRFAAAVTTLGITTAAITRNLQNSENKRAAEANIIQHIKTDDSRQMG